MPCSDYEGEFIRQQEKEKRKENPIYYAKEDMLKIINGLGSYIHESKARRDILTDMLCRLCKVCEEVEFEVPMPIDIHSWWIEHKKLDRERKANGE